MSISHQERLERLRQIRAELYEAEEQLMIADSAADRWAAGNRYDVLVAELEDLTESPT